MKLFLCSLFLFFFLERKNPLLLLQLKKNEVAKSTQNLPEFSSFFLKLSFKQDEAKDVCNGISKISDTRKIKPYKEI